MKLPVLFDFLVQEGIRVDLRPREQIREQLSRARREYRRADVKDRAFFDKACFTNPYSDSRILFGDSKREVARLMVGIDIGTAEVLLADRLNQKGAGVDAVMSHHPLGIALAGLADVMQIQTDFLRNLGVKEAAAQGAMDKRIKEVARRLHSGNHNQVVDAARLLGIPLLCCHTPADNHVAGYLQRLVDRKKPRKLKDVIRLLMAEPEYQAAAAAKTGPEILVGEQDDPAGRIFVDMTGGTEGSAEIFARLSQLGIQTLLIMHFSECHYNKVKTEYLNVINAGHMASDILGLNLLLDKVQKKGALDILECSGFRRYKRPWD